MDIQGTKIGARWILLTQSVDQLSGPPVHPHTKGASRFWGTESLSLAEAVSSTDCLRGKHWQKPGFMDAVRGDSADSDLFHLVRRPKFRERHLEIVLAQ